MLNENADVLLLDLDVSPDFSKPALRSVELIEKFIPNWLNLPHIAVIVSASG
jgi:hypothetical protein